MCIYILYIKYIHIIYIYIYMYMLFPVQKLLLSQWLRDWGSFLLRLKVKEVFKEILKTIKSINSLRAMPSHVII